MLSSLLFHFIFIIMIKHAVMFQEKYRAIPRSRKDYNPMGKPEIKFDRHEKW
jgi:hypothetical protein